jgi:hypothetical protein
MPHDLPQCPAVSRARVFRVDKATDRPETDGDVVQASVWESSLPVREREARLLQHPRAKGLYET